MPIPKGWLAQVRESGPTGPQFFVPPTSGSAANGKQIFNWDQAAAQLTRDSSGWANPTSVTFGFRSTAPATMPDDTSGFVRFNATQIAVAIEALALWSDVANITFTRVDDGDGYTNSATMLFANYTSGAEGAAAFAYYPGSLAASASAGDVWINFSLPENNSNLVAGAFGPHVMVHEIGHAIGIAHPADYDASDATDPTYEDDAVYWQDARAYTVMSYFGSSNVGHSLDAFAAGPQLHDIAAAQLQYGANLSTRTGDTIYGFNSNTGHQSMTLTADGQSPVFAIWDAGGVDTIDLSGFSTPSEIDLRAEAFSSAGPGNGGLGVAVGNIAIARGVVIENAIGGSGADTLIGNDADNELTGNAGADAIDGGAGSDTASYAGTVAGVSINLATASASGGDAAGDTLSNIENIRGSAFGDTLTGDGGANTLLGEAGDDTLNGGGGNDVLRGGFGNDNLAGGLDDDYYYAEHAGDVVTELAGQGIDTVETALADYLMPAHTDNLILTGSTNINATGNTGANVMTGNAGANLLAGGEGNDTLNGGLANDTLNGGDGNDVLRGGFGNDAMAGGLGDDYYYAEHAGDVITELSGQGTDTVETALANYTMVAHTENLILSGSADINATGTTAANVMTGNSGANTLIGGLGNDVLQGLGGKDLLTGGGGLDTFVFTSLSDSAVAFAGREAINTFAHGDKIDLSAIDANTTIAGNQAFTWTPGGFTGVAGQLYVQQNAARSWTVWADVNGDGNADFALNIYGAPSLNNGIFAWDFIL